MKTTKVRVEDRLMDRIDENLLRALREKSDTIYGLAKRTGHSWPTVRIHLTYLREMGLADAVAADFPSVGGDKDIWKVKK